MGHPVITIHLICFPIIFGKLFQSILIEAEQLILDKRQKEVERHIKKFEEEPELEILNGRYGPYITYKGSNYKIPKDIVPQDLSLASCLELIKLQDEKGPATTKKGRFAKKK